MPRSNSSKQPAPTPKSASWAKRSFDFAISLKSTSFLIALKCAGRRSSIATSAPAPPAAADRVLIEPFLHLLAERGLGRAAVMGLQFVAVENGRIMAGRNHHAAGGLPLFDSEGNRRRWGGAVGKNHRKTVAGKNLRDAPAKLIGKKAAVIADNDCFWQRRAPAGRSKNRRVAWAARSRFWKVKSSAITARQPSVPNLMLIFPDFSKFPR